MSARLEVLETSPHLERIQVVVVDDCSRDQTGEVLKAFAAERGIAWDDPALGIPWPLHDPHPLLSARDRAFGPLRTRPEQDLPVYIP